MQKIKTTRKTSILVKVHVKNKFISSNFQIPNSSKFLKQAEETLLYCKKTKRKLIQKI